MYVVTTNHLILSAGFDIVNGDIRRRHSAATFGGDIGVGRHSVARHWVGYCKSDIRSGGIQLRDIRSGDIMPLYVPLIYPSYITWLDGYHLTRAEGHLTLLGGVGKCQVMISYCTLLSCRHFDNLDNLDADIIMRLYYVL
jgi:hypothetical protein